MGVFRDPYAQEDVEHRVLVKILEEGGWKDLVGGLHIGLLGAVQLTPNFLNVREGKTAVSRFVDGE